MTTVSKTEKRLAVVTTWSVFASFGLGFILSGSTTHRWVVSLGGVATFVGGFVAHVIINAVYRTDFSPGEVIVGFVAFGVSLLLFILNWLLNPAFNTLDSLTGIAGFAALVACFVIYLVTKFGLKGAFSKFHIKGEEPLVN